jgi:hypothetical protein
MDAIRRWRVGQNATDQSGAGKWCVLAANRSLESDLVLQKKFFTVNVARMWNTETIALGMVAQRREPKKRFHFP